MNIKSQQILPNESRINRDQFEQFDKEERDENIDLLQKYDEALTIAENQIVDLHKEVDEISKEVERLRSVVAE